MTYEPPPGSIPTLEVPVIEGIRRVHMIGVGGAGMKGIAAILLAKGVSVSGSDLKDSKALAELKGLGAQVSVGHRSQQLGDPDPDVVVISTAIPERNAELAEARRRGLPVLARIQMLAALASDKKTLGVSGTHGKTTTTSMLAVILQEAGLDPTFVIGGDLNEIGSGSRFGTGEHFVAEADESDGSFLLLHPDVAVVTNVEEDHLDFYTGGAGEIREAFAAFLASAERAVVCGDGEGARASLAGSGRPGLTYGLDPANEAVLTPTEGGRRGAEGLLRFAGQEIALTLQVPGEHNLLNASAALLTATLAGVDAVAAGVALSGFKGVRRRFEYRGDARGARFFDDYAHHPTEIEATLRAARSTEATRIIAVFQPHRYTRTEVLWRGMGEALAGADVAVITDVYAAGEQPIPGVSGKLLVEALAEADGHPRVIYLPRRSEVVQFLASEVRPGDMVLTLGAGDITMVSEETFERVRESG